MFTNRAETACPVPIFQKSFKVSITFLPHLSNFKRATGIRHNFRQPGASACAMVGNAPIKYRAGRNTINVFWECSSGLAPESF